MISLPIESQNLITFLKDDIARPATNPLIRNSRSYKILLLIPPSQTPARINFSRNKHYRFPAPMTNIKKQA
jgi:hypothetical protein